MSDPEFMVPFLQGVAAGLVTAAGVVALILMLGLWRIRRGKGDG